MVTTNDSPAGDQSSNEDMVLEAHSFVLKDRQGQVKGFFGVSDEGHAEFKLIGVNRSGIEIAMEDEGSTPTIKLYQQENTMLKFQVDPTGRATVAFLDANGAQLFFVTVDDRGGRVGIANPQGEETVSLGCLRGEFRDTPSAFLVFHDLRGIIRMELREGGMVFFDEKGQLIESMGREL